MPIDATTLDAIARSYASTMTSIRGRRVHRLLKREFARYDLVVPAQAQDGSAVLLALADDDRVAVCRTDGSGPSASIATWGCLPGVTVSTAYDMLKDSLPIVGWTVWHPAFERAAGALTIAAAALPADQGERLASRLRTLGGG